MHKNILEKEIVRACEYIIEKEENDYIGWCEENDFNPNNYYNNTDHAYALAKYIIDRLDSHELIKIKNG